MAWNSTGNIKGPKGDKGDTGELVSTGWIPINFVSSGLPTGVEYKITGKTIEIYATNISGSYPAGVSTIVEAVDMPVEARPDKYTRRGTCYVGANMTGQLIFETTGKLSLLNDSGSTRTACQGLVIFTK